MAAAEQADISFWWRERSFSLIYFTGAVREHVPALLATWGYSILGEAQFTGSFVQTLDVVDVIDWSNRNISRRADYQVTTGTVLLGRGILGREETISQF